ncbi:hypothetical protein J2X85_003887 [Microbacterium trichothecenolyticum]|nr:hypothetical protein [Microbacterium trichothecenolyticum]MDR7186826.1 hypothetical protein [Microbacterium trichothecenolyticum]
MATRSAYDCLLADAGSLRGRYRTTSMRLSDWRLSPMGATVLAKVAAF